MVGLAMIAQMADALEALLKELYEKPKNLNASAMRTVASAVDFLAILFKTSLDPKKQNIPAANILVVDDEAISRRAITYALEKAKLKSLSAEDPHAAFDLLSKEHFHLVFLDVDMPGMNGFELCTKLRALPAYKKTPVVFVTSQTLPLHGTRGESPTLRFPQPTRYCQTSSPLTGFALPNGRATARPFPSVH